MSKDSLTIGSIIRDVFKSYINWFKTGDAPPENRIKSIWLALFLTIFGLLAIIVEILAYFHIAFYHLFVSLVPLSVVAFVTLVPGIYGLWVSFCCWRRVPGYDWFIVPEF